MTGFSDDIGAKAAYREMVLLRHLRHPVITNLTDVVFYDPNQPDQSVVYSTLRSTMQPNQTVRLCLVLEIMEKDLKQHIKKRVFTDLEIQRMMFQILCGVRFLHAMNVYHRDLKPFDKYCRW